MNSPAFPELSTLSADILTHASFIHTAVSQQRGNSIRELSDETLLQ